jgi:Flp pilus assembly protein TadG
MTRQAKSIFSVLRRLMRARAGAEAIEFALVAPAMLLLICGAVDFGRLMWTQSALHLSVEQAARCGSVGICTTGTAPAFAAAVAPQLGFTSSTFTATAATCGFQVSGAYTFSFIVSGLFPLTPRLTATSCVP